MMFFCGVILLLGIGELFWFKVIFLWWLWVDGEFIFFILLWVLIVVLDEFCFLCFWYLFFVFLLFLYGCDLFWFVVCEVFNWFDFFDFFIVLFECFDLVFLCKYKVDDFFCLKVGFWSFFLSCFRDFLF